MCGATSKAQFLKSVIFLISIVVTNSVNIQTFTSSSTKSPKNIPTKQPISAPSTPKFPGIGIKLGGKEMGQMAKDRQGYHAALMRARKAREALDDVDEIVDIVDDLDDVSWDKITEMLDDYVDTFDPAPRKPQLPPGLEKKKFVERMNKLMNRPKFKPDITEAVDEVVDVVDEAAEAAKLENLRAIYARPGYRAIEVADEITEVADDVAEVIDEVAEVVDELVDSVDEVADVVDEIATGTAVGAKSVLESTTEVVSEVCTRTKCYQKVVDTPIVAESGTNLIGPAITGVVAAKETYDEYQKNGDSARAVTTFGASIAKTTATGALASKACLSVGFAGPVAYLGCVGSSVIGASLIGAIPDTSTLVNMIHGDVEEKTDSECESNGMKTPDGLTPSCEECKQKSEWESCGITNDEGDDTEVAGNSRCYTYCKKID